MKKVVIALAIGAALLVGGLTKARARACPYNPNCPGYCVCPAPASR